MYILLSVIVVIFEFLKKGIYDELLKVYTRDEISSWSSEDIFNHLSELRGDAANIFSQYDFEGSCSYENEEEDESETGATLDYATWYKQVSKKIPKMQRSLDMMCGTSSSGYPVTFGEEDEEDEEECGEDDVLCNNLNDASYRSVITNKRSIMQQLTSSCREEMLEQILSGKFWIPSIECTKEIRASGMYPAGEGNND